MTKRKIYYQFLILCSIAVFCSCSQETGYVPKKRGYHRIELPMHEYSLFDSAQFPYRLNYSKHALIYPDKSFMSEPYWLEIFYPQFSAQINISYKRVKNNLDSLSRYFDTSSRLTHKHHIKATAIDEYITTTDKGYTAVIFELEGDVPSHFHWFITDSTRHFVRAVLYFPSNTKNDSLAPIIAYMKEDMMQLMNSVEWKNK
jgi:gliding motility-associated lipoprotein GldD